MSVECLPNPLLKDIMPYRAQPTKTYCQREEAKNLAETYNKNKEEAGKVLAENAVSKIVAWILYAANNKGITSETIFTIGGDLSKIHPYVDLTGVHHGRLKELLIERGFDIDETQFEHDYTIRWD